ncbi:hypothetical protein P3T76_011588 [Phytophthora citrophthora]|uniref:Uncharacterized protein n=1 Tax=Phytophthora citrophthora TaxID=4793 RepID=A0AAD9G8M3_9STRA|nr:hypothetical protein P3T76_011588 [Phytophthora citrophthora]
MDKMTTLAKNTTAKKKSLHLDAGASRRRLWTALEGGERRSLPPLGLMSIGSVSPTGAYMASESESESEAINGAEAANVLKLESVLLVKDF